MPGPQLEGGAKGGSAPKQKFRPPKMLSLPSQTPFPLRQFQDGGFFLETNKKLENK